MTTVGPREFTLVPLVYDSDAQGLGGPPDMTGPVVGGVRYLQDMTGTLEVTVEVEFGHPGTTYDVVLTAGPSHDLASGWTIIGQLKTDASAAGSVTVTVPAAVLQQAPLGAGYRSDHLDVLQVGQASTAGIFTAGAINYFVCDRGRIGTSVAAADDLDLQRGSGDAIRI